MSAWHEGRAETKHFVVFPPLGEEAAFAASKERIGAHLRAAFPDLTFELADHGLYEDASVLPLCGAVGGENSSILAPPSEAKLREIEEELKAFSPTRTGLN